VDRHENIGEGFIGNDGFRRILSHAELRSKAFILETPCDTDGDDRRNVDALKRLYRVQVKTAPVRTAKAGRKLAASKVLAS